MPNRVALINVVGLTPSLMEHAPRLRELGDFATLEPVLPAVTCSVQASMLTGQPVDQHGIVANGWYYRDQAEVKLWARSGRLIEAPMVWDAAKQRDASVTCANLFWRHAAYTTADTIVIERPIYRANGRKMPDCYSNHAGLRDTLQHKLGTFPLFNFWGPFANITSSKWIADATRVVDETYEPTLTLTYLPHLDYPLQKLGPEHSDIPDHVRQIDDVAGELVAFFQSRHVTPIIVSEYGIESVNHVIEINKAFRHQGWLAIREECGGEHLDYGASKVFAVADHQVAHVYLHPTVRDSAVFRAEVQTLCESLPGAGVETIHEIHHSRAGEFVLEAKPGAWFSYDYWLDNIKAPDFADTIDIHRKPGYDPRELYCSASKFKLAMKMLKNKLNLRQRLDIVPLDPTIVKGSHGRVHNPPPLQPIILPKPSDATCPIPCTQVHDLVLDAMFPA